MHFYERKWCVAMCFDFSTIFFNLTLAPDLPKIRIFFYLCIREGVQLRALGNLSV